MQTSPTPTFSLDIGTRKVIGLLTVPTREGLRIVAAERQEHATRSMLDGQVHDVAAVAEVVARVKERLEARTGLKLTEAAVAAAGRALRTCPGRAQVTRPPREPIGDEESFGLELEAVQDAQTSLAESLREQGQARDYLFMGHSVLSRRLDGFEMGSLVGQRGAQVEVEVIATFLPRSVVDSLLAVLERVGLEMAALTLEPIAAINVVIPPSMRHLNLVLVDIGAGTSDIAITRQGTIVAYAMVPVAGDEITEALSSAYLLDFPVAEEVKRRLTKEEMLHFSDVLGQALQVAATEAAAALEPAVSDLAGQVAQTILALNGKPPQAVVLVGGGSQTPGLGPAVARALGLPPNRVAVRGREAIQGVVGAQKLLAGPEAVTPLGIAVAASGPASLGFAYVYVDGQGVRLFHPARLRVADALLAAGYRMRDLQARMGQGLTVFVGDQMRLIPGTLGQPARIMVNGAPATLDAPVRHRDQVTVEPAVPGAPGRATVAELLPEVVPVPVVVNGEPVTLVPDIWVNGAPVGPDYELQDNDRVDATPITTVGQALAVLGMMTTVPEIAVTSRRGEEERVIRRPGRILEVDGLPATAGTPLRPGAELTIHPAPPLTAGDAAAVWAASAEIRVQFNGRPLTLPTGMRLIRGGEVIHPSAHLADGDVVIVDQDPERPPLLADALAAAGFSANPPLGAGRLRLEVNGRTAEFTTPLQNGDWIEVGWERPER